jgi:membrane protease YdiL (CAAX protease family)
MEPNAILNIYAGLVLAGLPLIAWNDARRGVLDEQQLEFRRAIYGSVAFSLLLIAGITLGVAAWQDVDAGSLGWRVPDALGGFVWGIGFTLAGLAVAWLVTHGARAVGLTEGPLARLLMPRTASEQRAFLVLSGVAALCEEYVFRGFLLWIATAWLDSPWLGAILVSLSFGLSHGYQRLAGVIRAGALGFTLAIPVILTGSLFPAVVSHFWINAAIGLGGWRYLFPTELLEGPAQDAASVQDEEVGTDSTEDPNREAEGNGETKG